MMMSQTYENHLHKSNMEDMSRLAVKKVDLHKSWNVYKVIHGIYIYSSVHKRTFIDKLSPFTDSLSINEDYLVVALSSPSNKTLKAQHRMLNEVWKKTRVTAKEICAHQAAIHKSCMQHGVHFRTPHGCSGPVGESILCTHETNVELFEKELVVLHMV